jgi:archaetidylinositol phosphate synthase
VTGSSWTHRLARIVVRPMVGSGVTPNHLTSLRLVTGLLACATLLPGEHSWDMWAGWLWLVSAFLDRADGELARIGGMSSPAGHAYDYFTDNVVNSGFFVALGIGLRQGALGEAAIALGLWTGAALFLCGYWSEELEWYEGPGAKAYSGVGGFDPDDLLYLLAPILWLGGNAPLLVAACLGATFMTLLTGWRLRRRLGRQSSAGAAE